MLEKEYIKVGRLNTKLFYEIGQKLITDEVIFTYERVKHVETKRMHLFEEIEDILPEIIYNPDYVYKDWNGRENTVVLIKTLNANSKLNVVLKIAFANDEKHTKNSIITMMKIGEKTFNKIAKNKGTNLLFEKLDNNE